MDHSTDGAIFLNVNRAFRKPKSYDYPSSRITCHALLTIVMWCRCLMILWTWQKMRSRLCICGILLWGNKGNSSLTPLLLLISQPLPVTLKLFHDHPWVPKIWCSFQGSRRWSHSLGMRSVLTSAWTRSCSSTSFTLVCTSSLAVKHIFWIMLPVMLWLLSNPANYLHWQLLHFISRCWRLFMIKLWNHSLLDARAMNNCNIILERFQNGISDHKESWEQGTVFYTMEDHLSSVQTLLADPFCILGWLSVHDFFPLKCKQ